MFPKGPRFEPQKISDIPGPNTYSLPQDSQSDAYKRGAFLEKSDRFAAAKTSDVPGPGSYNSNVKNDNIKATAKQSVQLPSLADRYAVLQQKVEDLEKLHNDGKRSNQNDIDRLQLELRRAQKSHTDQAERIEKQKKQNQALEARLQELKKETYADQAEIKDLRVKLRMAEHERTQLLTKREETGELKKVHQILESKRRDELREKDRRIAELEKALTGEKRNSEMAQARLLELKAKGDEDTQAARAAAQTFQIQATDAQSEAKQAQISLTALQDAVAFKEDALLALLEQHRSLLGKVAEEYGRLASSTVARSIYSNLQVESASLRLRGLRLERKLANSEEQVVELANLIRQTKEQNAFLARRLQDVEGESNFYRLALQETRANLKDSLGSPSDRSLEDDLAVIGRDILAARILIPEVCARDSELSSEFYRFTCDELLLMYSIAEEELQEEKAKVQQQAADLSSAEATHESIVAQLQMTQAERNTALEQLNSATQSITQLQSASETLKCDLAEVEARARTDGSKAEEVLKKERETVQRLTKVVQMNRMAEDGLRADIEQLTIELADAERYQEAYYLLVDEVGSLVARNALAEEEAQRLSTFNAEILGHNNPAQRIMYVDRIRKELAETKHKLTVSTREHEVMIEYNEDLQHELDMYKSVMVPAENKPRTNITRVHRPPLVNLNNSTHGSAKVLNNGMGEKPSTKRMQVLDDVPGDMTLEEIM